MIIGITGTDGAGKGSVVDYLVKEKGFTHYSARSVIVEAIQAKGLTVHREHMRMVANELRATQGRDVIVVRALKKSLEDDVDAFVVESIRAVAEAETLKQNGGILLAVDAEERVRYERIVVRGSESDNVSFEEFQRQEQLEMNDPDPNGMQKGQVMKMADYTVLNNGTIEELQAQVDEVLKKIVE